MKRKIPKKNILIGSYPLHPISPWWEHLHSLSNFWVKIWVKAWFDMRISSLWLKFEAITVAQRCRSCQHVMFKSSIGRWWRAQPTSRDVGGTSNDKHHHKSSREGFGEGFVEEPDLVESLNKTQIWYGFGWGVELWFEEFLLKFEFELGKEWRCNEKWLSFLYLTLSHYRNFKKGEWFCHSLSLSLKLDKERRCYGKGLSFIILLSHTFPLGL